jgi:hypothetical protein
MKNTSSTDSSNPTASTKKKLSKKTLSFIGLLSIMLIVVGISMYVGYNQGQNETATENQIADNSSQNSEENTEDEMSSDGENNEETQYPIVTDLEVSTIPTPDDSLTDIYPIGEDWQEFYIDEIDTTVYHFGEEPSLEDGPEYGEDKQYRIPFDNDLTVWISKVTEKKMEGFYMPSTDTEFDISFIIGIEDVMSIQGDRTYYIPLKNQDEYLKVTFDRISSFPSRDMHFVEKYLAHLQNPNIPRFRKDIVYYTENSSEKSIFYNGKLYDSATNRLWDGDANVSKDINLTPIVQEENIVGIHSIQRRGDTLYFMLQEGYSSQSYSTLYTYNLSDRITTSYYQLPLYGAISEIVDESTIKIKIAQCWECGGHPLEDGIINLDAQTFQNLGKERTPIQGFYQKVQRFSYGEKVECDMFTVVGATDDFFEEARALLDSENTLHREDEIGRLQVNINLEELESESMKEKILNSSEDNVITLILTDTPEWGIDASSCFSYFDIESVN